MQKIAKSAVTEDEIPQSLRNRPVLNMFQLAYWNAYQEISGSRQFTSAGAAEIPYSEKVAWLDENDIVEAEERRNYLHMITILDAAYLDKYYKK